MNSVVAANRAIQRMKRVVLGCLKEYQISVYGIQPNKWRAHQQLELIKSPDKAPQTSPDGVHFEIIFVLNRLLPQLGTFSATVNDKDGLPPTPS